MNRALFYIAGGILIATAMALGVIELIPAKQNNNVVYEIPPSVVLAASSTTEIKSFQDDIKNIESRLSEARTAISEISSRRTPTPGLNASNAQMASAVNAADQERRQQLGSIVQQLTLLSQQVVDIQQRATSMEIRIQDFVRDFQVRINDATDKNSDKPISIEATVALLGILSTMVTLGLAVHKEKRESAETNLKIKELEQKLAKGYPENHPQDKAS
jgi:chromosome segregation ATPase